MLIQEQTRVSPILVERRHWLLAEVVFGSPKKRCAGVGICSMNPLNQSRTNSAYPCEKVMAQLTLIKPKLLLLRVVKQGLCEHLALRQFPQNKFTIETDFELPSSICSGLNITDAFIPSGTYRVEESEEDYGIHLILE